MATENVMMEAVKRGGDRQELHEQIRTHSMEAGKRVKVDGESNDLIERIAKDSMFGMSLEELNSVLEPKHYIGRCAEQVEEFIDNEVNKILTAADVTDIVVDLKV